MLTLDHVHRVDNPLGAELAAKLRWIAADALGCDYGRKYAEADLARAGVKPEALGQLREGRDDPSPEDRLLYAWARKMTLAAYSVTDEEMAELTRRFGDARTVALVHTLAYANFQNRLFLALGCRIEPGGPYPPLNVKWDRSKFPPAPARPPWKAVGSAEARPDPDFKPPWRPLSFKQLEDALEEQKARKPRIAPPPTEVFDRLPLSERGRIQAKRVIWTGVSLGHQPKLVGAWFDAMGASSEERKIDPVFGNSFFWAITRTNECFY
jgi:hypothetical protein